MVVIWQSSCTKHIKHNKENSYGSNRSYLYAMRKQHNKFPLNTMYFLYISNAFCKTIFLMFNCIRNIVQTAIWYLPPPPTHTHIPKYIHMFIFKLELHISCINIIYHLLLSTSNRPQLKILLS